MFYRNLKINEVDIMSEYYYSEKNKLMYTKRTGKTIRITFLEDFFHFL